ncbi:MAG: hypothetical protein ABL921_11085 [Pirellula sp.]
MRSSIRARLGMTSVIVLVVMSIIMSILMSAMIATIRSNRERKVERSLLQLRFVNEAGAARAAHLLRIDSNFPGDEWNLNMEMQQPQTAMVRTTIRRSSDGVPSDIEVLSILDSDNPHQRIQQTKIYPILEIKE